MSASSSDPSSAPLLRPRNGESDASSGGGYPPQTTLALLLGRAVGRRGPSLLVRETAARELDVRRADWGYSAPVVALDMMWNIAFIVVSVAVLIWTVHERPNVPVRVWICGYALQCLIHVVLVWFEYRKRVSRGVGLRRGEGSRRGGGGRGDETEIESDGDDDYGRIGMLGISNQIRASFVKRFESANTVVSFLWWIIGFYWVVCGGEVLLQDAPRLYWLTVAFLAFDVFFAVFCMVLAFLIGIALCCCLPCIIAILYSVAGQDGASDADLSILPKYRFRGTISEEKPSVGAGLMIPLETSSGYVAAERVLLPEDAECCICLSSYEDGAKLIALPCNHNFHDTCIVKWLKMNATCPLCKFDIVKGNEPV